MKFSFRLLFALFIASALVVFVAISTTFNSQARMMPLIIGVPVLLLALWQLFLEFRRAAEKGEKRKEEKPKEGPAAQEHRHSLTVYGWVFAMFGAIYLVGFVITTFFYPLLYMRIVGHRSWRMSAGISLGALAFLYVVMILGLNVELYDGVVVVALRKAFAGY
jgi:hypothetical protein